MFSNKYNNNDLFTELLQKQLKNIEYDKKLQLTDLKRICKYICTSMFDKKICCLWNGYVSNSHNSSKGTYINFYFKTKKVALHRLLYCNFIGILENNEYLKFTCKNKGICCNLNHIKKYKYNKKIKNEVVIITNKGNIKESLILTFD
jgi:hypothetical protein